MCTMDIMYQNPYSSYFSYQRASLSTSADTLQKYGRLHDTSDPGGLYGTSSLGSAHHASGLSSHWPSLTSPHTGSLSGTGGLTGNSSLHSSSLSSPHTGSSSVSPPGLSTSHIKEEFSDKKTSASSGIAGSSGGSQNQKCMMFTYFSGDVSTNVDEHFNRALDSARLSQAAPSWKDPLPMSQRNFPASFWNSNYQPTPSHHDFSALGADPYMASSLHSVTGLHTQDWRYPLTSQAHSYSHPSVHDFAYPAMATSSRYSHPYGSLLPSASSRLGASQCELSKQLPGDSWGARYHAADPLSASSALGSAHESHLGISSGKWY